MSTLYIMCGCPGSGKTTIAKQYYNKHSLTTKYVSRDDIRFSLVKEGEPYFSKEIDVYREYIRQIKEGLDNSYDVIADATHLNHGSRSKLLLALGKSLKGVKIVAVVVYRPTPVAIEQNKLREGTRSFVPEDALISMAKAFEEPFDEEGFDKIIYL